MSQAAASSPSSIATVQLEVRVGRSADGAPRLFYEVGDGGFLVGSVPGCDLRLPGANLAPVLCLVARQAAGASLRKLAPVQPISVNGRTVTSAYLEDGDRITLGPAEMVVRISGALPQANEPDAVEVVTPADLIERVRLLDAHEKHFANNPRPSKPTAPRGSAGKKKSKRNASGKRHGWRNWPRRIQEQDRAVATLAANWSSANRPGRAGQQALTSNGARPGSAHSRRSPARKRNWLACAAN